MDEFYGDVLRVINLNVSWLNRDLIMNEIPPINKPNRSLQQ